MSQHLNQKKYGITTAIVGVIILGAVSAYLISIQPNSVSANSDMTGKIGADIFETQKEQALNEARRFILESSTFKHDGISDTLKIKYVSVMESQPVQYNVEASYTSTHSGYGDRTDQMVAQVLTDHNVELIITKGTVVSAINDRTWDEIRHQYITRESDLDFPMNVSEAYDYDSFINSLEKRNIVPQVVEILEDTLFSVPAIVISVNGENIQVFEFASATEAQNASVLVSEDGTEIGTSIISWMDTPHFFTQDKIIVLYVGHNQEILDLLETLLDKQFAGM